jgi:hypothetical protein
VTVEPPSTEKLAAVPRPTLAGAAAAVLAKSIAESNPSVKIPTRNFLPPTRNRECRRTARESLVSDSHFIGTPRFMGAS